MQTSRSTIVHLVRLALPIMVPVLLAGCANLDPYRRDYMWQPNGSPAGDFAAQVANPMDLVKGRGTDDVDGGRAAAVIAKWNKDGPGAKPLSGETTTSTSGGGS